MILQAFSGDTIARLADRLINKEATIDNFNYVIFHVDTNDIAKRASFQSIISDCGNLIGICRKVNPTIRIIISAIIPRPVDHEVTDPMIRKVNKFLQVNMSHNMNFKFICTYKPFMFAGKVKLELFAKKDGGLHINTEGTSRLRYFFLRVISTI